MSVDVEGKSLVDLLDMLEPAPVPEPITMMPQTWGWLVLAVLLIGLISLGARAFLRHRHANAYRRAALSELTPDASPAKTAEILRRTALAAYPRRRVAGLFGASWLNFLQETSDQKGFSDASGRTLLEAPYKDTAPNPDLTQMARDWIRTHKPDRRPQ